MVKFVKEGRRQMSYSVRSYFTRLSWTLVGALRRKQKKEIKRRKSMDLDDLVGELKSGLLSHVSKSLSPGGWYKGIWARDAMHIVRGLSAIKEYKKAKEIVEEVSNYQLGEKTRKNYKIVRGRGSKNLGYKPREADAEFRSINDGAIPTTIYPNNRIEIYAENPDIDSTALWIIAACECALRTNDLDFSRRNHNKISKALTWLSSRDIDRDFLLEQGENEEQADCLRRRGKVVFSQALWFSAVDKVLKLEEFLNQKGRALELKDLKEKIRGAINEKLWLEAEGYYVDYIDGKPDYKLNQDTSFLITFGIAPNDRAKTMLNKMEEVLWNEYGAVNVLPPYEETGPLKLKPGMYLNSAVWPWICGYEISARFAVRDFEKANELLKRVLPYYPYEWIDLKGRPCGAYPFTTNMGSLLEAISRKSQRFRNDP
ncbi:MAG: hypothetical protein COS84_01555 [Armatimonadetes bacterium CG07_land_8_20_14_0_80_40_9]|nr:MAG: hypothetical protein COS84_01555 [Armatimonadetes bacterium CG07_land_8_20_14_0_80_40_9]